MTDQSDADDAEYSDEMGSINIDEVALREAVESAFAEGGMVYREAEVAEGITVVLDWDIDDRLLPVCIALDADRVPETATDDLGDASSALDGLQADLDGVFFHTMNYGERDYGNRACYERTREETVDGSVSYHGTIVNPDSLVAVA